MPKRVGPDTQVDLTSFRKNCDRLLPANHPFRAILPRVPPTITVVELSARIEDWLAVLET